MSPLVFEHQRWDDHFIQWLDGHYESIELLRKDRPSGPILWIFLTERAPVLGSKRQVHYVNDPELARTLSLSAGDREVHVTNIQLEQLPNAQEPRLRVALDSALGRIVWDFRAQGAPSAQHGGRLIDALAAAHDLKGGLLALYVAKSAVSAQETRVALGAQDHPALAWPEISHPPYFVAYRGVHSAPAYVAYFPSLPGVRVRVRRTPPAYRDGAEWLYHWQPVAGPEQASEELTIGLRIGPDGNWRFSSARVEQVATPGDGVLETTELVGLERGERMSIRLEPPMPDLQRMPDASHTSRFSLSMAGVENVLTGTLRISKAGPRVTVVLHPEAPPWATQLSLHTRIDLTSDGYDYTSESRYPNLAKR